MDNLVAYDTLPGLSRSQRKLWYHELLGTTPSTQIIEELERAVPACYLEKDEEAFLVVAPVIRTCLDFGVAPCHERLQRMLSSMQEDDVQHRSNPEYIGTLLLQSLLGWRPTRGDLIKLDTALSRLGASFSDFWQTLRVSEENGHRPQNLDGLLRLAAWKHTEDERHYGQSFEEDSEGASFGFERMRSQRFEESHHSKPQRPGRGRLRGWKGNF